MAEFKTHLTISSLFSSFVATALLSASLAYPQEVLLYFTMGVIGGLLPDIDSDSSMPVRLLFTFIATVISFLVMFSQSADNSIFELFTIWFVSFIVIKFFFFSLFTRVTVHRGIIHSIPAGFFFWFLSTIILYRVFAFNRFSVWMAGLFVFSNFIMHLIVDELHSLNLFGTGVKKSLGTAFKFGVAKDIKSTLFIYLAVFVLLSLTPDHKNFSSIIMSEESYANIKIFPKDQWFKEIYQKYVAAWR